MPKYIILGKQPLAGEIDIKGAKNSVLKIIPVAILSTQKIKITNIPEIEDTEKSLSLIESLGGIVTRDGNTATIDTSKINNTELKSDLAKKFRASIMFVGPILARFGEVKFSHPGGCVIGAGSRPIDLFIEGFEALGAKVEYNEDEGFYHIQAEKLIGCDYFFSTISVTGTEALMMTAVLAKGKTTLKNCAMEPEIEALANYLNSCGAKISGAGTPIITIEGVDKISAGEFEVIPDRIEAGSIAILAAATNSEIRINKCNPDHIESLLNIFDKIGIKYEKGADWIQMKKTDKFLAYGIKTHEYPGFPTDLQSPYTVFMTQAQGSSLIHETIYDRRLFYVDMLSQMGADITICDPHRVVVNGPTKLYAKKLISPDLRAGMAMIIAGLIAEGETEIDNIYQIDRGYEKIDERLNKLGAKIQKVD
ncbi:MAG: UDP-N-acetylglucosamine 1-carboxyvinyltransferase [Patescibacteria group bacterium]